MTDLFDPNPEYDNISTEDLIKLVWNDKSLPSSRLSAIATLGRRCPGNLELISTLSKIATDPTMQETRFLHSVSLAYVAITGLTYCGTAEAKIAAQSALKSFSE